MKRSLSLLLLLAVVLVAALWFGLRERGERSVDVDAGKAKSGAAREAAAVELPQAPTPGAESRRVETDSPPIAPAPTSKVPPDDGLAELRGRFLFPDGSPASQVKVEVHGWAGNDQLVMKHGAPEHWDDPKGTTDLEGRFSFRFDPPLAYQFVLKAELAGYSMVCWRWFSLPPREVTDIGEIKLVRPGTVHGRIVDTQGKPVRGEWQVTADSAYKPPGEGGDQTRARAIVDPQTCEFRLEGLPPGPAKIQANSRITNWIDGPSVVVTSGETVEADIVYDGPDNSRRIVVVTFCQLFHVFNDPAPGSLVLSGPGGERGAVKIANSSQSWSFDDLEPGSYTAEIRDPRFLPWSQSGVTPGQSINAKLKGSAAVVLSVLDDAGAPVEDYRLRLQFRNVNFMPSEFEVRKVGAALPVGGRYDGLIPSDCTLRVDAAGYSTCEVLIDALAANETRAVTAQLARGATLRGIVLDAATRAPVAGAEVRLGTHIPEPSEDGGQSKAFNLAQLRFDARREAREARTDEHGRFEYTNLSAGTYSLRASSAPFVETTLEPLAIEAAAEREVELLLPASGFLAGRLIGPEGAKFDGLTLDATPKRESTDPFEFHQALREKPAVSPASDGSFRIGPLPAGEVEVVLVFPSVMIPSSFNSSEGVEGGRKVLDTVAIEGGKELHRDFDLRAEFPGRLRLTIRVDGSPGASLVAVVQAVRDEQTWMADRSGGQSDSNGVVSIGPLAVGDWNLVVRTIDSGWWWSPPNPIRIQAATETVLAVDVALVSGSLTAVAEDDGKPLANRDIYVSQGEGNWIPLRSDAEGRVALKLPIGSYALADGGEPGSMSWPEGGVKFEWTAAGGVPSTLRLPRAAAQPIPKDG